MEVQWLCPFDKKTSLSPYPLFILLTTSSWSQRDDYITTVRRKFSNFSFLLLVWLFSWNFFFLFSFLTKSISNVFHPVVGWPTSSREAAWFFQGRETTSFCWPSWSSRCQWIRQKPCRFSWLVTSFSFSSGRFFFLSFFYKSATESRRTSSLPFYCM